MEKAVYRIIDANSNRAREAMRVMEEFCRFVLNHKQFNAQLKDFRHKFCSEIGKLDQGKLIAARDTTADVGTDIKVDNQLSRKNLFDSFTAATKRLPEALRAITETCQAIDPEIAAAVEQLRYKAYTLEKEINMFASPAIKYEKVKLYVLLTESDPARIAELVKQCSAGGADCVQLRCKNLVASDKQLLDIANEFVETCKENNIISIINDRPDIAVLADADGLHLGQDDISVSNAKKLMQRPMIIGKSTHNMEQLNAAIAENPTYVGLGPAFDTQTKPHEKTAGLEYLEQAMTILPDSGIGHVAIGGITLDNLQDVINAGIDSVAVCSAVTNCTNPAQMCKKFQQILKS